MMVFGVCHRFCLVGQMTDSVICFVGQVPLPTDVQPMICLIGSAIGVVNGREKETTGHKQSGMFGRQQ